MNIEQQRADFEAWAVKERIAYRDEKHGLCFYNGQRHSYWLGYQAGRAALQSQDREALIALVDACPRVLRCSDFHHEKADRHSHGVPCKPLDRYLAAIDHARRIEGEGK